jgi:O-antigen ligase
MDTGQADSPLAPPRHHRVSAAVLGVGVALATATQLRFGNPVGPGELILLAWCAVAAVAALRSPVPKIAPALRPFLLFWACSLPVLVAGWISGWGLGLASPGALRDFLAYVLLAAIVACLAYKPGGAEEIWSAGRIAIVICTLVLFPLLLYASVAPAAGPLRLWHMGRFLGWSRNPNQVPLAVIVTPFLALHGWVRYRGALERCGLVALACCSVAVGLSSRSDALVLGWAAGAAVLALHSWILAMRGGSRRVRTLLVVAPLLAAGAVVADGRAVERVARELAAIQSGQERGAERTVLWTTALEAAAASPVVGIGPGAHARIQGGLWVGLSVEAHNTLLDWGSATGLVGTLLLCGLLLHVGRQALRAPPYFAALTSLLVFGIAHHFLRHPIVWIYLLLLAGAGAADVGGRAEPLLK